MPAPSDIINVLVGLVRTYMGLRTEQVMIYNQKWKLPTDAGIYISVAFLAEKIFGSSKTQYVNDAGQYIEAVTINSQETYTFDIFSRNGDALARKEEIVMATQSSQAQQLQEQFAFQIGTQPIGFVDLSRLEGTAMLNRYQVTINLLRARVRESLLPYFDKFEKPATSILINP